jgi:hypothetical protein
LPAGKPSPDQTLQCNCCLDLMFLFFLYQLLLQLPLQQFLLLLLSVELQ